MSLFEVAAKRASNDFALYCLHVDKNYRFNWHHQEICKALTKIDNGEIDRLIICMPPRHGKSTLAAIYYPSWFIGKHPQKDVIISSYSGDLAVGFGRKCRNIVDSDIYRTVFDNVRLAEDSKSASIWHTQEGGGFTATGVGGATTGKGAHLYIVDDPFKNREEAESQVIRDKVWDWYSSVVYTRLEKKSAIILIMTRWHQDDLVGRILKESPDEWTILDYPAIAIKDEEKRNEGEALWPDKYPIESLKRIKKNITSYDWSALYQQKPTSKESQEFKMNWFRYYDEPPKNMNIYMTVDPAISKKDKACNSAIVICGYDSSNKMYILDYVAKKLDPGELIDWIFLKYKHWRPMQVGVEVVAYQEALVYFMKEKMKATREFLPIKEIRNKSDKEQRIRRLIPLYQNEQIFHKSGMKELEDELLSFPQGSTVDIIDALAMQLDISTAYQQQYKSADIRKKLYARK